MRAFKEFSFMTLLSMVGGFAGWWLIHLFGAKATSHILVYGSGVIVVFMCALRMLNAAFVASSDLSNFDHITRDQYDETLRRLRKRFGVRMVFGVILAALSAGSGGLLSEPEHTAKNLQVILGALGGMALLVAAVLSGAMAWATTFPAQYIAAAKKIAQEEKRRRDHISALENRDDILPNGH